MGRAINRRAFLRGDLSGRSVPVRPPWAVEETLFVDLCSRCDDCRKQCPESIIETESGFPKINFKRGECTFCGECVERCKTGALQPQAFAAHAQPWQLKATISDACLAMRGVVCRSCGEQCDERAITFRPRIGGVSIPELDQQACSGCGACVAPCPVAALSVQQGTNQLSQQKSQLEESA
ncbi:ferredoxin-type protein NapF [Solemya pervernicosa gill symbiont]|uniref:Ferredoxin-type protein NapF n=2 Tax=Gammaproteobacteria incertae sedis TaxID=118884 RepID=A0A1T2L0X8_9GAMM|nr:ferredoxin-type protein NapF [Candidatus Reidiella endopervernicosa]OOZ38606.1 ferredoxin-type protein NapF [Solemya pervernicosa gill symbiont]QKQ24949.1 ferredoxin-type protein NapF [Candidatus Reidiella endopervernicosa]